jgi:hypothetical protein
VGTVARGAQIGSRGLVRGMLATAGLGLLSLLPLAGTLLWPRAFARLRDRLSGWLVPRVETDLTLTRSDALEESLPVGFTTDEQADRVAGLLLTAGLAQRFARLFVVLGHGSSSLNNPHLSAYDCGACGGRHGAPNARLFAAVANRPEVRAALKTRGVHIPEDTWFVGGSHDTASDAVTLLDLDRLPASHAADLAALTRTVGAARARNALERCRRFEGAPATLDPAVALAHVEGRTEDLAEPRVEYGHSSNAVCVVGRRALTRGLFLDRRSFLVSYDPDIDPDDAALGRLLGAAGPVCAGINLEYYFSTVDNARYGCGTKLPHNVAGLLGVTDGAGPDLRTGLTLQMVEIHEPVRLLLVVETTPARLERAIATSPVMTELVRNDWIRLATVDPATGEVSLRERGAFAPFVADAPGLARVASSLEHVRGRRDHLPVVAVGAPRGQEVRSDAA